MEDQQQMSTLRKLNPPKEVVEIEHTESAEGSREHQQSKEGGEGHKHGKNCRHGHGKSGEGKSGKRSKNYGIIVYCVFTCLSCLYLETQCFYPQMEDTGKRRILTFISWLVVVMALWSYYQTITTSNFLPKVKGTPKLLDIRPYLESNYLSRTCEPCKYIKPPRVSHCSTCGGCIMKLDHHCMWTQNCIGYRNQRPFFLFTVYMTIGVLQFWFATYAAYHQMYGDCKFFSYFEPGVYILWFITCISAFFVGLMILALTVAHTMYILTNHTTLMSMKMKKVCPCPVCQFRDQILEQESLNHYDRGEIQNIRSLFGTSLFLAPLPFIREIEHDFVFEKPNPTVTPLQAAKFTGEYEAENLREKELVGSLRNLRGLYSGQEFRVNGEIIEV